MWSSFRHFLTHVLKRFGQFVLVVFIGINLTFLITHFSPIDPVEASVSAMTAFSSSQPEAVELMRKSLRELYGLQGGPFDQYVVFWKRILVADFGPSLSVFPTPVSTLIVEPTNPIDERRSYSAVTARFAFK